jgi:hypothetical protein
MLAGILAAALDRRMSSFLDAGTGAIEAPVSGTLQVPFPGTVAAGNFLILHVVAKDGATGAVTLPSGWTSSSTRTSTDTTVATLVAYKIADGTETGNLNVTCTAGTFAAGRIYRFSSGTGVEGNGAAIATDSAGTALNLFNVTTTGGNRLAVQLLSCNGNGVPGSATGESGADYTEAVAEYYSASGPVTLSCQVASVSTATAISGGSVSISSSAYRIRHGLAIKP